MAPVSVKDTTLARHAPSRRAPAATKPPPGAAAMLFGASTIAHAQPADQRLPNLAGVADQTLYAQFPRLTSSRLEHVDCILDRWPSVGKVEIPRTRWRGVGRCTDKERKITMTAQPAVGMPIVVTPVPSLVDRNGLEKATSRMKP